MKKLLIVDVLDELHIIHVEGMNLYGTYKSFLDFTELTFTTSEINYLLTLHNMNENGIHFAPVPDIEEKLKQLR